MQARKTTSRLATFALALGVAAGGTVPVAQAHHAPREGTVTQPPTRIITVTDDRGFDFGAAGIGAGGAIGVVLLAGGSILLLGRNHKGARAEF